MTGLPITGIRTGGEYARKPAPEMLSGDPYCPFRADIWQLGTMFKLTFGVCVKSHVFFPSHSFGSSRPRTTISGLVVSQDILTSKVPRRFHLKFRSVMKQQKHPYYKWLMFILVASK